MGSGCRDKHGREPNPLQGGANAGWHNNRTLTPKMDALVADGVELDRHYVFFYCSPSRSSLLTGRADPRHREQWVRVHADGPGAGGDDDAAGEAQNRRLHDGPDWEAAPASTTPASCRSTAASITTSATSAAPRTTTPTKTAAAASAARRPTCGATAARRRARRAASLPRTSTTARPSASYPRTTARRRSSCTTRSSAHTRPTSPTPIHALYADRTEEFANYNGMISAVDSAVGNVTDALKEAGCGRTA